MAMKKRYHTVNGMLIGETSNGVRRGYLPDALGSVVATVDNNGSTENTYRYKPYGSLLAKTGSATDPRFLWVGNSGSRQTGLRFASSYNRYRHLEVCNGQWTSVDPLWPQTSAYCYADGNPTTRVDPTGLQPFPLPEGYAECHNSLMKNGPCTDPVLLGLGMTGCSKRFGSPVCLHGSEPPSPGCKSACCFVCEKTCAETAKHWPAAKCCKSDSKPELLKCARASIATKLPPDKVTRKKPLQRRATACPTKCSPPGEGVHFQWTCVPRQGDPKPRVITALCCPAWDQGRITSVCVTTEPCHTDR